MKREQVVHHGSHGIGDEHLLCQTHAEASQTNRHVVRRSMSFAHLQLYVVILNNGTGNQLGKERDVKQHARVLPLWLRIASVYVNHVRERLKSVERYAQRKRNCRYGQG